MADETIFAERDQFADKGMRLHAAAGADHGPLLDFCEGSDEAVIADLAAIEVAGRDDLDPGAEFDIAHTALMPLRLVHDATPRRLNRGVKRRATSWPVSMDS